MAGRGPVRAQDCPAVPRCAAFYAAVTHPPRTNIAPLRPHRSSSHPSETPEDHAMLTDFLFVLGGLAAFAVAGLALHGADRL